MENETFVMENNYSYVEVKRVILSNIPTLHVNWDK